MGYRVNLAELTKLIRDGLDAAGKTRVPVVPPGTAISVLPAVVLAPRNDDIEDGWTLRYGFDVTLLVPRNAQASQYEQLTELETIVLQALIPSTVRFEGPLSFVATGGGDTGEPPALARIIPLTFVSDVSLCP